MLKFISSTFDCFKNDILCNNEVNRIFITGINDLVISEISCLRPENLTHNANFNNILGFSPKLVKNSLEIINN